MPNFAIQIDPYFHRGFIPEAVPVIGEMAPSQLDRPNFMPPHTLNFPSLVTA
jgi:hypothetical protein